LDFHATMEEYFLAKRRLFLAGPEAAVVNVDDPYGRRLAAELDDPITFATSGDADWRALDVQTGLGGSRFRVSSPVGELEVRSSLPGRFNVSNLLGALAAASAVGVEPEVAVTALTEAGRVPGRFEPVEEGQDFAVVVDYAHTPDSLENVLRSARDLAGGHRVLCVFGCGGDRDRGKRPLMGAIAADLADLTIVTSDNPRSEDPEAIIAEVVAAVGEGVETIARSSWRPRATWW
jgi:UDP-N-acetylmuramoyl-L-alanyl-D-glutamate--2,6-diaminopimelate ligase